MIGYMILLNDGRWIKVSKNIYIDWNGKKKKIKC